jgi:hypothetical protein
MVMGGVDVVPMDAVSFLFEEPLRVPCRDDVNVMAGGYEACRKRSRVILHASDAVARNGNDANPHRSRMLVRRRAQASVRRSRDNEAPRGRCVPYVSSMSEPVSPQECQS